MKQNYSKKNKLENGPRPLVIKRILAFPNTTSKTKKRSKTLLKTTDFKYLFVF